MIEWFCSNLGLPLIEEKLNGELRLNAAARDIVGAGTFPTISAALGPLLGESMEARTLDARLADARRGEPSELTLAADGDPVDVLILNEEPLLSGCLLHVRPIAVIKATQTEKGGPVRNDPVNSGYASVSRSKCSIGYDAA